MIRMEIKTRVLPADEAGVAEAAQLLRQGQLVALPTETVYGIAADARNGAAVRDIFVAKGRPQDNPLIVHVTGPEMLPGLVSEVPERAQLLMAAFCPGPLTIIMPRGPEVAAECCAGLDTVGIRLPSHPMARALIRESGVPLAAPSANTSGRPSTTTAEHVMRDMDGKIAAILDGGACGVGVESTVITLALERPRLLRPGGITLEQLRSVLGEVDVDRALYEKIGDDVKVSAPGMKYRHYAPKAPVTVVRGDPDKTAAYIAAHLGEQTGVMCFDEYRDCFPGCVVECFGSEADLGTQAREVFDRLRAFDDTGVQQIWAQCPSDEGLGLAVANRIKKAAGFSVVEV